MRLTPFCGHHFGRPNLWLGDPPGRPFRRLFPPGANLRTPDLALHPGQLWKLCEPGRGVRHSCCSVPTHRDTGRDESRPCRLKPAPQKAAHFPARGQSGLKALPRGRPSQDWLPHLVLVLLMAPVLAAQTVWQAPGAGVSIQAASNSEQLVTSTTERAFDLISEQQLDARPGDVFEISVRIKVDLHTRALPDLACYERRGPRDCRSLRSGRRSFHHYHQLAGSPSHAPGAARHGPCAGAHPCIG